MIPKIGLVAMAGQFEEGFREAPVLFQRARYLLDALNYKIIEAQDIVFDSLSLKKAVNCLKYKDFDILCICVCTWSEDNLLLDLLDYFDKPVILWAFPAVDTGSLCGVQQICCVLKELGKEYFYVYGDTEDRVVLKEIGEISTAAALVNRMKHVKLGTVGGRLQGMTEIAYDEFEIKDKTGVRVINLDEKELETEYTNASEYMTQELWESVKLKVGAITSSFEHCCESLKYYQAIKSIIERNGLEGLCIKCYTKFMGKICLGYSLLAEEGIVCGCEGDLNATVAMKILYELTGRPVHNTDLMYLDREMNTIVFSHCGSGGFSLAESSEDIVLGPVRLANTGVAVLFPAAPGKVTLVNLVGRKGTYRMSVLNGEAVKCGMEFPGNPLKVKFDRDVLDINRQIAKEGIGHHWMSVYGDVSNELEYFCKLKGIRFIKV